MVGRSDVLIGRRYLAIRDAKQKAKIRSGRNNPAGTHRVPRCYILVRGESAAEMAVALCWGGTLAFSVGEFPREVHGLAVRRSSSERYNSIPRREVPP